MKEYFKQKTLEWVNYVRNDNGLPAVPKLEKGRYGISKGGVLQADDCSLARTISQSTVLIGFARCFGKEYRTPWPVRAFLTLYDHGRYPELITNIPVRDVGIDYLDFETNVGAEIDTAEEAARVKALDKQLVAS